MFVRHAPVSTRQIYYHLEEYDEAVRLALTAGEHFDVSAKGEYVDTINGESGDWVVHCLRGTQWLL